MRTPLVGLFVIAAVLSLPSLAHAAKPFCGDGKVRGNEQCDGADLDGQTCQALGFGGGTLDCAVDCTFDTGACTGGVPVCGDGVVEDVEECEAADDAACPGACSAHCACPSAPPGDLEIHVIDVGQGDAILVVSPDGFVTLVDAGGEGAAASVSAYLMSIGITELDYTVVSHFHADHVGGMDVLLGDFPQTVACFDHGGSYDSLEYLEYDAAAGSRRAGLAVMDTIDMGPSVTAQVLHTDVGSTSENLNSLVLRIDHGDLAYLLGGDCEGACEATFDPGPIEVYKVHHHGSSDSTTESFLAQMSPYTALISVGAGNPYDHPDPSTLSLLAAYEVDVYRTDLDGDLAVIADGAAYTVNGEAPCALGETRVCGETDVGACSLGTIPCVDGMWGSCEGAVYPSTEICDNGLDDDCDGWTDLGDPECDLSSHVVIAQVGYDTPGDDALEEFVDLYNPTLDPVSLDGWSLSDNASTWSIPSGTSIDAGAYLSIARNAGGFVGLYGRDPDVSGMTLGLGNTGDALWLDDDLGEVDYLAWEGYDPAWTLAAPIGDSLERTDPTVDSDSDADFAVTSPASPRGGTVSACGNGTCDGGEDCTTCPDDCPGRTGGKPSKRFCCGNGSCEAAWEDALICPIDCP
jgi:beta-lactamase superfamily II metal-dependent hydrolase